MDNDGNTPLHWAAEKNQVESVRFLLSKGANPNLQNNSMMAPLHLAVQGMHNEVVKVSLGWDPWPAVCLGQNGQPQLPGKCTYYTVGFTSDLLMTLLVVMLTMKKMMMMTWSLSNKAFTKHFSKDFTCFSSLNPHFNKLWSKTYSHFIAGETEARRIKSLA